MTRAIVIVAGLIAASLTAAAAAQQATFRSTVDAVTVPVSVTSRNAPVPGLSAADFQLFDNDVKQEISLTAVDRLPVDVTLMIDTSGSINGRALDQLRADIQEMGDLLQPNDRVRLVTFARTLVEVFGLQPAGAQLPVEKITGGGVTAFYDALASALAAFPYTDRPQFIFALTDGRDTSSFLDADRVTALARHSTSLLCVGLVNPSTAVVSAGGKIEAIDPMAAEQTVILPPGGATRMGSNLSGTMPTTSVAGVMRNMGPYLGSPNISALKEAAGATGGLVYDNPSGTAIPSLFRRVLDDFRASYVLTYTPTGVARGGWHTITVKTVRGGYTIRARKGYGS